MNVYGVLGAIVIFSILAMFAMELEYYIEDAFSRSDYDEE